MRAAASKPREGPAIQATTEANAPSAMSSEITGVPPTHAKMVEELPERQIDAVDEPQLTMRHSKGDCQSRQHKYQQNQRGR